VGIALESCGKMESEQRCQPHLISGHHGPLRRPTGVTSEARELSVTTVLLQGREPSVLTDSCREKCGVVLGRGIGDLQGRAFRIAHMGHVSAPTVFGVLGAIEMEWPSRRWTSRTDAAASTPPWNIFDVRNALASDAGDGVCTRAPLRSSFGANVGPFGRHRATHEQDQEDQHDRHDRQHPEDVEVRERGRLLLTQAV
jgi:hypothetical protein